MADASVTRRILGLTIQDPVTGWYAKEFPETTIPMLILPRGSVVADLPIGNIAMSEYTGFSGDAVVVGDEVKNANGDYFLVESVQEWWWLDKFSHYTSSLKKIDVHVVREATSGVWHLDSDVAKTDPRYRHKLWLGLDTYLTAGNLLKDDGVTLALTITCFSGPDYPLKKIFSDKEVDGVFSIDKRQAQIFETWNHHPYKFMETVPITCYAIDKTGITGTNLVEQMEQEIRHICSDHPIASIRNISSTDSKYTDIGGLKLWETTVTIQYIRVNDDYLPTYPICSYGAVWTYEGDRLSGGVEGTWTLTAGGSTVTQAINAYGNLYLSLTVFVGDAYTSSGTNLSLSSTIYTQIRWRYRTTGNATAKIILEFSDASTQTVLAETASTAFTVGVATITSGKTINHIHLYCCDGTGTVEYDFIQIYKGTYTLPNVVKMDHPSMKRIAVLDIPGMIGNIQQTLGAGPIEVPMTCDLDMEHPDLTWKRSQTGAKTDVNKSDFFMELAHETACNGAWTWLDLGDPAMQFKAIFLGVEPSYMGEGNMVTLTWREYRHGTASDETATERFGLAL